VRREADEVALEWVREYTFSVNNPHDPAARNTFWFLFGDGRVTYNDLNTRLEVKKRARRSESDFQRPAQARPRPGRQPVSARRPVRPPSSLAACFEVCAG